MQDVDRKDLKITTKVFISSPNVDLLKEALDQGIVGCNCNDIFFNKFLLYLLPFF